MLNNAVDYYVVGSLVNGGDVLFGAEAIALMNTERPVDALRDARWLAAVLPTWDIEPDRPITEADLDELRGLRSLLRRLSVAIASGRRLSDDELGELNAVLAKAPIIARVEADGDRYVLDMTPVANDWRDVAVREVAGAFSAMLRADPSRLKICAAAGCDTVFWDETRSRTRSWCDNRTCGNRVRVQRHRTKRLR